MRLKHMLFILLVIHAAGVIAQTFQDVEVVIEPPSTNENTGFYYIGPDARTPKDIGRYSSVTFYGDHYLTKSIIQSTALKTLVLQQNKNTEFSDSIQYIVNLRTLTLSGDSVKKIGAWIGNCKMLKELKIVECPNLRSLPDEIGNLTNLTDLTIERTGLTEIPAGLTRLPALKSLSIDCNAVAIFPKQVWSISTLRYISLRGLVNFPSGISKASQLRSLTLMGAFQEVSEEISKIPNLEFLYVVAPLKSFRCASESVQTLWLMADSTSFSGDLLLGFPSMEKASLDIKSFTSPIRTTSLVKLNRLSLRVWNSPAIEIEDINPTVSRIHFEGPKVKEIKGISNFENLERLVFARTQLSSLPTDISLLKKLWQLAIVDSKLTDIPLFVYEMPLLKELDVRKNIITAPISEKVYEMPSLKSLYISENKIPNLQELKSSGKFKVK